MLPIPILYKLHLDYRKRMALCVVFSLGLFVVILSGIRIHTLEHLKVYTHSEKIVSWSIGEINLGVLTICVPTYWPLFHAYQQKVSSKKSSAPPTIDFMTPRAPTADLDPSQDSWDHVMSDMKTPALGRKYPGSRRKSSESVEHIIKDENHHFQAVELQGDSTYDLERGDAMNRV